MTLKEKFTNAIVLPFEYEKKVKESLVIADDFAIDFAIWCDTLREKLPYLGVYEFNLQFGSKSVKELLEIYKKEKGLWHNKKQQRNTQIFTDVLQ